MVITTTLNGTDSFNNWLIQILQGFITDNERALEDLFGDEESSRRGDACLNVMGSRIATVFASLRVRHLKPKCWPTSLAISE